MKRKWQILSLALFLFVVGMAAGPPGSELDNEITEEISNTTLAGIEPGAIIQVGYEFNGTVDYADYAAGIEIQSYVSESKELASRDVNAQTLYYFIQASPPDPVEADPQKVIYHLRC